MKTLDRKEDLDIFKRIVPIGEISRNFSSFANKVCEENIPYFVTNHNKPEVAVVPIDVYTALIEAKEDLDLLLLAQSRMKMNDHSKNVDFEDVLKEAGLTLKDLEGFKDIDIE